MSRLFTLRVIYIRSNFSRRSSFLCFRDFRTDGIAYKNKKTLLRARHLLFSVGVLFICYQVHRRRIVISARCASAMRSSGSPHVCDYLTEPRETHASLRTCVTWWSGAGRENLTSRILLIFSSDIWIGEAAESEEDALSSRSFASWRRRKAAHHALKKRCCCIDRITVNRVTIGFNESSDSIAMLLKRIHRFDNSSISLDNIVTWNQSDFLQLWRRR